MKIKTASENLTKLLGMEWSSPGESVKLTITTKGCHITLKESNSTFNMSCKDLEQLKQLLGKSF